MKNKSSETPKLEKKLKQARLPFQVLSPRATGSEGPPASKKRKLSTSIEDKQNVKKVAHVKENLKSDNQGNTADIVQIDSDDELQEHAENTSENSKSKQIEAGNVKLVDTQEHNTLSDSDKKEGHIQIDSVSDDHNVIVKPESDVQLPLVIGANNETINKNSDKQNFISETLSEKETENESINNEEDDASDLIELESEDEESKSLLDMSINSNLNESANNCTVTNISISEADDISETSETSNIITPNEKRKRKCVTTYDESLQTKKTPAIKKTLTPKQLQRKLEIAKAREEKEKARQESIRKKQEEKLKRKLEKDEEKKKEREEKEKEREEKEKKRLADLEKRNEEKRLKDEEKRIRDEEKRKKEEQKEEERRKKEQEKEEAENKKKKAAAAFVNFFVPKKLAEEKNLEDDIYIKVIGEEGDKDKTQSFMPFCVKADMRLAPIVRQTLSDETKRKLDYVLQTASDSHTTNYLETIKNEKYKLGKCGKTWPISEEVKDDLMIMDEVGESFVEVLRPTPSSKAKLILFHENRRPPYWGTWTKKSNDIGPRTPFGKDKIFDYEVDSDSEWEEEEPGESLHGSDDEKDKEESEDEYEVDNDFFVPHGYLSDEEQNDEEKEPDSPEIQKAKLKILQTEFNEEMKKKTEKIKPRLVGCVWAEQNGERPQKCAEIIWSLLCNNRMIIDDPIVLDTTEEISSFGEDAKAVGSLSKKTKLHEDLIPDLIKLLHGNINGRKFLVHEYQAYLQKSQESEKNNKALFEVSNIAIARKIKEIGQYKMCREEVSNINRKCWCVDKTIRDNYKLADLSLINSWKYILTPKNREKQTEVTIVPEKSESAVEKTKHGNDIKKFTKVLSAEDRQKQFVPTAVINVDEENCSVESQITAGQKLKKAVKRKRTLKRSLIPSQSTSTSSQPINVNEVNVVPEKRALITNSTTNKDTQSVPKKRATLISVPLGTPIPSQARNTISSVNKTEVKTTDTKDVENKVGAKNEDGKYIAEDQEQTKFSEITELSKKKIPSMFLGSSKSTTTKQKQSDDNNVQSSAKIAGGEPLIDSKSTSKTESACTNMENVINISADESELMEVDAGNTSIVLSD